MRLRALAMLSCTPLLFSALPTLADTELVGSPLQFHGTVVSRPCNIEPQSADQVVEMDTVIVKTLYRYGHSNPVPFNIKLTDCKTNCRASWRLITAPTVPRSPCLTARARTLI